jgi:hypothetical protein
VISGRILSESWFLPKIDKAYLKQFSNLQKTKLVCQIQLELIQSGNPISLAKPVRVYFIWKFPE